LALMTGFDMLKIATTATTGVRKLTGCENAMAAGLNNRLYFRAYKGFFESRDFNLDYFTRNRMSNKDDNTFMTGNEVAPVGYLLNLNGKNLADSQ
jgi:hypothetical protein